MNEIVDNSENAEEIAQLHVALDSLAKEENELKVLPPTNKGMRILAAVSLILAILVFLVATITWIPILFDLPIERSLISIFSDLSLLSLALEPVVLALGIIVFIKLPKGTRIRKIAAAGIVILYILLVMEISTAAFFLIFFGPSFFGL